MFAWHPESKSSSPVPAGRRVAFFDGPKTSHQRNDLRCAGHVVAKRGFFFVLRLK
jgi:hypothetical protein